MRKVLVKQYNGEWTHAPDLDKEISSKTQKQRLSANHLETLLRNLTGSANSYLVLDVIRNDQDQILKVVFPLLSVKDWDFTVNESMDIFIKQFSKSPQIILMNKKTLELIERLLPPPGILGEFHSKLGILTVCLDENISDEDFALVHDEQAELI